MDFEFTGEETPEQLEKMLEGLGMWILTVTHRTS